MSKHLKPKQFEAHLSGKMSTEEAAAFIQHLNSCDECLAHYDHWYLTSRSTAFNNISFDMDAFQQQLSQRINTQETVKAAADFGFAHFLRTIFLLLKPFLGGRRPYKPLDANTTGDFLDNIERG